MNARPLLLTAILASFATSSAYARRLQPAPPADALRVVRAWIGALRKSEPIEKFSSLPFYFLTTNKLRDCEGAASTPGQVRSKVDCIRRRHALFVRALNGGDKEWPLFAGSPDELPQTFRSRLPTKIADWVVLENTFYEAGLAYYIQFCVSKGRVLAVMYDVDEYE
jgi:hypothetical protein